MKAQKYLDILREIKDVAFATVDENGKPQVRIIDVMIVENEKLYFCTARGKAFYQQLIQNENVAITGMNQAFQMIRLNGVIYRSVSYTHLDVYKRQLNYCFHCCLVLCRKSCW